MGCSMSKLDDEEVVQLCKDRKKFIKQAVDQRLKFAAGHVAYIQAMERVSAALREYIDGDEPREFSLDSFTTPMKETSTGFISLTPNGNISSYKLNFYKPSGTPPVSVEERPPSSPETTYRVESYSPIHHFGMDSMYASPMGPSMFHYSPDNRPNYHTSSPQTSQWDFFWNPFSSLDYYRYHNWSKLDQAMLDDENEGLKQVRAEEGIPELEEETEYEDVDDRMSKRGEGSEHDVNFDREQVVVEDVNDSEDSDCISEISGEIENKIDIQASRKGENTKVMNAQSVGEGQSKDETPGFTVYVNRRPTSMAEVIKEIEDQFMAACNAARKMSSILEARRAIYSSSPNDVSGRKMLNPVALFRSSSSRSSSSRILVNSLSLKDSGSDYSEHCLLSGSHQSSLDRLYAWEKKLYQQVRAGERIRLAYEKKCAQLKNRDVKGEDPSFLDKTRACLRDLQTQIKVSIHAIEAISKRIEALRDEELEPQLLEFVQGIMESRV